MMDEKCFWFVFDKQNLLIENIEGKCSVPLSNRMPFPAMEGTLTHSVGELNDIPCKAYAVAEGTLRTEHVSDLRASFDILPRDMYDLAGKSYELVHWDLNSRFCSYCGTPTERFQRIGKRCPKCRREIFPQISPAIIVLIQKGNSVLMVHARNFRGKFRGLVAGFVEPGESLEQCLAREVMEETGLKVRNVRYFGSQPWPYPSVLMVGFTAEYESGEVKLQDEELDFGRFFTIDNLPELPRKLSLARKLIDWWVEQKQMERKR